jgi:poly(hydroxyalkanoate) depolymerase family esterase
MKLNHKLFAQMRAAARTMLRGGPAATADAVQQALHNASALHQAARNMVDPTSAPVTNSVQAPADLLATIDLPRKLDPHAHAPGAFSDASYTNDAGTRDYKLYVPSTYRSEPVPLIVMLHGCTQDPDDFATGTQMNLLAEELACLVVYPAQSQQANPSRCWNWFNEVDQQRDQGEPSIIAGITRHIIATHAVDAGQVYVAGLSAGGAMATIMGTLYPDLYAAVGVHSGLPFAAADDLPSALAAMKGEFKRRHTPGHAMPIIVFHGDQDKTVHPAAADELIAQGALPVAKGTVVEPGRVPDGHAYTRTLHQRDDGNVHAEHWIVHGGGHAWFGGNARGSYTDGRGPDASREMLRFFRTQR